MEILPEIRELRTFAMLADELSFTRVATRQNTVQSAISAQISKLEGSLKQQLVSRGRGKNVTLTPDGEVFLVYVRRILSLSEEAVEAVRTANARQVLRLGTTVTLAMSSLRRPWAPSLGCDLTSKSKFNATAVIGFYSA